MLVGHIISKMCLRCSLFSRLPFPSLQYMRFYVPNWPLPLNWINKIYLQFILFSSQQQHQAFPPSSYFFFFFFFWGGGGGGGGARRFCNHILSIASYTCESRDRWVFGFLSILCDKWSVQIIMYIMVWRSYYFVSTLLYLIISVQTYLEA